jgi:hypothetical protein
MPSFSRRFLPSLLALGALALAGPAQSGQPSHMRLQYAGYLVDSPVLDARVELSLGGTAGPYRMGFTSTLVGILGDMFQFHMTAASQGRDGGLMPRPSRYHSEISIYDNIQTVSLDYGANGHVALADNPPTEAGQDAVARGLLAGTVDPLTAALAIVERVSAEGRCAGQFRIFDGARRYDLSLAPAPAGLAAPRIPAAPGAHPIACDAAVALVAGFPQYAVDSGMYPSTARFWLARDVIAGAPALLRLEAESGLGKMRFDLRAILPGP